MDFSRFDKEVDLDALKEDVKEAEKNGGNEYPELPDGTYTVKVENMEIAATKDGRPMFKAMFRIVEGDHKKQCIFMNRVIYGTKNDANMIASVVGFLEKLEPSEDVGPISFTSYSDFNDLILDIMEDIDGALEYEVEYKKDAFNSVSIKDVFEV